MTGARFISGVAGVTRTSLQVRSDDPWAAVPRLIELLERWRRAGAHVQQWITLRTVVEALLRTDRLADAAVVLGAVLAPVNAAEVAGSDADRLDRARTRIIDELDDGQQHLDTGAAHDLDSIVAWTLDRLRTLDQ